MKNSIAIRSLMCPDHANNIPPKVFSLTWFLGKRCNYDCSYCSPHIHDAVSPFINVDISNRFIDQLTQSKEKIKWNFTGGEPFIDPGFIKIINYIKSVSEPEQINSITNGSLPLKAYQKFQGLVDGITFSIHLERSDKEITETLKKIKTLKNSDPSLMVSVNLMFLPGKITQVKNIIDFFLENEINYVVRKIHPPELDDKITPAINGRKTHTLLPITPEQKINWKQKNDEKRNNNIASYYDQEEIEFLSQANKNPPWKNVGIWYDDGGYQEINSDQLVDKDQHNFLNWVCYAGVDSIYIDYNGYIYRGLCLNDGYIAHISDDTFTISKNPTICQRNWCGCNIDIPIRKAKNFSYLNLIDGSKKS